MNAFLHPEFLAIAAALISVPIIIHLINRLRFKRLRWAAMEFLLKAQKRNRRRLIVEQLLLLALRCLLVGLVGLLVLRFVGFDVIGQGGNQKSVHIVLLDDTLSMRDKWKENDIVKDSFRVATKEILIDKIAKKVRQGGMQDSLLILPLSRVADPAFQPKPYDRLNDEALFEELKKDVELIEPSLVHLDLQRGVKKAKEFLLTELPGSQITLHVLSDFRQKDWGQAEGEGLHKELVEFAKQHKAKILLVDTAHPYRNTGQGGVPSAHDNIGIVDLRAGTRIVGKDMPVNFTITIANYSAREADVHVAIFDDKGGEQFQVTQEFNPPLPLKIKAGETMQATFDYRFTPDLKPGEPYFAQIAAHLESAQRGKLENDGLDEDNVRYATVEVRDQVPILVIDGEAKAGREDERVGKDSFFLQTALVSVPGSSYRVEFGDLLGGTAGVPTKALERPDLRNFPTLFLLNVRDLTPKQLTNLETYVKEGGGVGFFLGPQVSVPYYNKNLFKGGQGLFPASLKEPYYPPPNQEMLSPEFTGAPMLLLRDDLYPSLAGYPIFGQLFKEASHRDVLTDLPVKRYFQVAQAPWRSGKGQVAELATLPNDLLATAFQGPTLKLIDNDLEKLLFDNPEFRKYQAGFDRHRQAIKNVIKPTSEKRGYDLASVLDDLLKDKGREKDVKTYPNMVEFWADSDPKVRSLRKDVEELRDQVRFGDPFVLAHNFGKGKVVVVTTTAGKLWNEWGGGSRATTVYQPFIWEMQNFLSSQSDDANLAVGTPIVINVDSEPYKQNNRRVRMERSFQALEKGKKVDPVKESDQFGVDKQGLFTFAYDQNVKPGLYVAHLYADDSDKKLGSWGHVFNVDTPREGPLQRVAHEDLKTNILDKADGIRFEGTTVNAEDLVSRRSDMSESPLFFLLFLAVLVAEQALAVHLSFHLRGSEGDTLAQVTQARQAA